MQLFFRKKYTFILNRSLIAGIFYPESSVLYLTLKRSVKSMDRASLSRIFSTGPFRDLCQFVDLLLTITGYQVVTVHVNLQSSLLAHMLKR